MRTNIYKKKMIFPIMLVFLIVYLLANPQKIADKISLFKGNHQNELPSVEDKNNPGFAKIDEKNQYEAGQVVIKVKDGVFRGLGEKISPDKIRLSSFQAISRRYNFQSIDLVRTSTKTIYKISYQSSESPLKVAKVLSGLSFVAQSEPNYRYKMTATNPNDPKFVDGTQWALKQVSDHDIDAPEAWDIETGSSDTVVAVIDSGVDTDHPDLANNIWHNPGESGGGKESNGIDDDGNGYVDDYQGWDWVTSYNNAPADNDPNPEPDGINNDGWYGVDDGVTHGTHVAGIIAAETNNGVGVAGVCWTCKIMALRVLDDEGWGDYTTIAEAIEYAADNGADVINMSIGGGYSNLMDESIRYAYKHNVVVVAAAGNEALDIRTYRRSPVGNDGNQNMVIGVGASTSSDLLAGYSNYGAFYVDVTAPGSSIYSTLYTDDPAHGFNTDYGYMSGTSMASPHVAGLAALVKSAHPTWSGPEVRDRVIDLTNNIDSLNSHYTYLIGSGRINAERALNSANGFYPSGTPIKVAGDSRIWVILNGQKKYVPSTVFRHYYFDNIYDIVYISVSELNKYPYGPTARYPDNTLIGASNSGHYYAIDAGELRKFNTSTTFYNLDYLANYIKWSTSEYSNYPVGDNMTSSVHPTGAVITADGGTNIYLIDTYLRKKITSGFEGYYYQANKLLNIDGGELASYTVGSTLRYPDGILLGDNASGKIYYIEYGKRREFNDVAEVTSMGYRSDNIRWRDNEAVNYSDGQAMGF